MLKQSSYILEVCANSVNSAHNAQTGGADRIELCDNLIEGGTTPSYGAIAIARKFLYIKMNVIIRPRGGDFLYDKTELKIIKQDILTCRKMGVDGIVLGILLPDGRVDKERICEFVELAKPMSVTFHRAFDMTCEPFQALEDIIETGCHRILTSGHQPTALVGADLIAELIKKAGDKIIIMPGSGVNETTIQQIKEKTGAKEFHVSARNTLESKMIFRNEKIKMGGLLNSSEYEIKETDIERIKQIKRSLGV